MAAIRLITVPSVNRNTARLTKKKMVIHTLSNIVHSERDPKIDLKTFFVVNRGVVTVAVLISFSFVFVLLAMETKTQQGIHNQVFLINTNISK